MINIIIVTYNGISWIKQCLDSCNSYPVVVVDNASTDNTVLFIEQNFPRVSLLKQKKNLGFGQANNKGITYALKYGAEFFFLLNQDAYLEPGCIERLMATQKKFPVYGILSPLHLNGQGKRLDKNFSHYLNYNANPDFYSDYILNKPRKEVYNVPFVNAAGWLLSRSCIEKVGGFDPLFFHYGEDDNYCQRVKYHGFKIGVCPDAKLKHDRETREYRGIDTGTPEYWNNIAKTLKSKYADINYRYYDELLKLARKRMVAFRKNMVKLNFRKARFYKRESAMFSKVHNEVLISREINRKEGLHYLDFSKDE